MLTRHGLLVPGTPELKKELTVRPVENALGIQSPSFKVYRPITGTPNVAVPRYYGTSTRDRRRDPVVCPGLNFIGKLRTETRQPEAFDAGIRAFESIGGGVLSLPCGYGKTTVALALSARLKVRTMIVVHKEFLANQWVEKIKHFCPGASIGRVQGDVFDIEKDFVIGMIQTLCQREFTAESFDSFGFLIVDEAHHIGAPAFSQFMFKMCPKYTLGLTATPERKDGLTRVLYWFLGPEFFRVERVDKRTRVTTLKYSHDTFKESPPVTRFGKLNMAAMITILTEIEERNALIVETALGALRDGRRVLILSDRREHCFELRRRLGPATSALYIGGMKEAELEESSKAPIVIGTFQLAQEGLDIPELDTVILSTPKSDIKQSIGRIMREDPTKTKERAPLIFDIVDQWSVLFSMYRKRCVVYREGGFETETAVPEEEPPVFGKGRCLFSS